MGLNTDVLVFDKNFNVEDFTFILSTKSYKHIGKLNNISRDTVHYKRNLNGANELSFEVYKTLNRDTEKHWNDIIDLKSIYVKESAAVALGLIGDMRAVDSLVKVIESQNGIFDKFSYLKEKAIEALCRLHPNNDRTFNALKKSLKDENPQVRINTLEALLEYETEEANELIKSALKDKDEEVQKNATIAMFNIYGEDILHTIIDSNEYSQTCKDEARNILENELDDYEE
jgi:HEAT repeat protein